MSNFLKIGDRAIEDLVGFFLWPLICLSRLLQNNLKDYELIKYNFMKKFLVDDQCMWFEDDQCVCGVLHQSGV